MANTSDICPVIHNYMERFNDPLRKEPQLRHVIITVYAIVSVFGTLGNMLVVLAVLRKPQMRTPRNMFIINLSISDLSMCLVTAPFTLKYILNEIWDLGRVACKIVSMLQAINIFVSTLSLTAIGLDRYLLIVSPTQLHSQRLCITLSFLLCWGFSAALATPTFITTDIQSLEGMAPARALKFIKSCGYVLVGCNESEEPYFGPYFKRSYTVCCCAFQYALPLLTLAFVYGRIILRLRHRTSMLTWVDLQKRRDAEERQSRVSILLVCLVMVFAVCWLPLNVYILLGTFQVTQFYTPTFAYCHVCGMISACVNPILYGILNENFRKEFREMLTTVCVGATGVKQFLISAKYQHSTAGNPTELVKLTGVKSPPTPVRHNSQGDLVIVPKTDKLPHVNQIIAAHLQDILKGNLDEHNEAV